MKPFVSILLLQLLLVLVLLLRLRKDGSEGGRVAGFFLLFLILYGLSTPWGSHLFESTLHRGWAYQPERDSIDPEYIVVLSGGFHHASTPEQDLLSSETAHRTAHATRLAREFPEAAVVFTGAPRSRPEGPRMVDLMADFAISRGLDPDRVLLEPEARNTREHPLKVLELEGVEPSSPLLVVTSTSHLPRSRMEFDRTFSSASYAGAGSRLPDLPLWRKLLPTESALASSTTILQEWVGLLWYHLTAPPSTVEVPSLS